VKSEEKQAFGYRMGIVDRPSMKEYQGTAESGADSYLSCREVLKVWANLQVGKCTEAAPGQARITF
jgi:hypothetical protein